MNYRKPFFVLLAGVLLLSAAPGRSQTFENPSIQGSSSFAVITDSRTARECRPQMTAYKQTLEAEGLPVYIVSHDWTTPEQVRDVLRKLYAENALEGCVFIGDVPIAMITKAQHLTSAFKMDERDHPLHETSVPSDRFYDDFDLQFVPQGTPSQGLFHYYEMSPDSPQYISCDIYSGRIKAQKAYGDPYKQIARYLEKAVAEHRDATPFDQFVSYTGHGSYSNSLIAWRDEQQLLDEQFGNVFSRTHNAKFLRYSMQPFVKESLIREVRRDDVDMMVFHEHGMPHRQYLSGTPYVESAEDAAAEMQRSLRELARRPGSGRESAAKRAAEKGLDSTWYNRAEEPEMLRLDSIADLRTGIILEEVEAIAPNARFVVFDACYNGDYREDDFIAGHYIMAPGRCVTTFANSVNVLQDKSAFDLLGLLGEGLRIGAWAKNIHILESHVIGDPTYRFKAAHPELDINSMALKRNNGFWLGQLDNAIPDIQNLAMIRLWENDYPQLPAILLDKCSESPYSVVRYNAFRLLESLNGPEYKQALMLAAVSPSHAWDVSATRRSSPCSSTYMSGTAMPPASFSTSARRSAASTNSKSKRQSRPISPTRISTMPGRRNRSCSTNSSSATSSRPASPRRGRFSTPRASPAGGRPASVSSRTAPITSTSRNTSPCWATSRLPRFCVCGWPRRWRGSTSRCGAMKSPMPDANCSPAATVHRNWPKRCSA